MSSYRNFAVNVLNAVSIAVISLSLWAYFNQPVQEPAWPQQIPGYCFQPMRLWHDPIKGILPAVSDIRADLALVAESARGVRTYSVEGTLAEIPALALERRMNVNLGAWISQDRKRNQAELDRLIGLARRYPNVKRAIVGNEVVLRGDIPIHEVYQYLDQAREALAIPVSTAEPWHVWIRHTELADHVDYLAVHLLPYWEGVALEQAVAYVVNCVEALRKAFPQKPIVLAEVGWPSNGRTMRRAVASQANQAVFLRRFIDRAQKENYTYYIMEAFDQPWKIQSEGTVGAYWGVWDVQRHPKFPFTEPIVGIAHWHLLAWVSVLTALITLTLLLTDSKYLLGRGRSFLAVVAYSTSTVAVWVVYDYTHRYLTLPGILVGVCLICGMILVITVLLAEAHEWAEVLWVSGRRRSPAPIPASHGTLPMVSIHVAAYNEPPAMLMQTLDALATLAYPEFEVLVVDNNTPDENIWQPVAEHCRRLGPRFRFFHVDQMPGYKAGALNYALQRTHPAAEVIGVIDSDYIVAPNWLADLVPQFENPATAIVQAPQDYRDARENAFKAMCYNEYSGFFFIGMITRNERNAIIQHGTMTLIRRRVLESIGGWAEWCITEDAELGLRVFIHGHEALYIPESYGRGLIPDSFAAYKKQRFRWVYGAVQILRRHAGTLAGLRPSRLTAGQRYHFWAGWLPWMADALNLLFNLGAIIWSIAMIASPLKIDPPLVAFSSLPLAYLIFKSAKLFNLYQSQARAGMLQALSAGIAGIALSHTIAKAFLMGLTTRRLPFFRTPKMDRAHGIGSALRTSWEEGLILLALWSSALGIFLRHGTDTSAHLFWVIVLMAQSLPYAATLLVSWASALPGLKLAPLRGGHMVSQRRQDPMDNP